MDRSNEFTIRAATNADAESVIALIDRVYREYGDRVHLEKVDRDLVDLENAYARGGFWLLDDGETVRGTVAITPCNDAPDTCYLKRLYLDPALRGTGWGACLLEHAIGRAQQRGLRRMNFWTDVRFTRAHAFYEKHGFVADGRTRTLDDAWEPYTEFFYSRAL